MCTEENDNLKTILIVDDEEAIRYSYDLVLSDKGYTVVYAEGAEEALEILSDEDIDVIFLDLNLPDLSGIDLCKKIREFKPDAVINAITGYAPFFDVTECYKAGFDDYLEKPLSMNLLITSVYKAFEKAKKLNCS